MRLTPPEITAIKQTVFTFDPNAKIYLFGSRVRDDLKGGDIDLLVLTDKISSLGEKIKLELRLEDAIGEQKIDIVIPNKVNQEFVALILKEGLLL
jgi:predicted nucleotidyltransferase